MQNEELARRLGAAPSPLGFGDPAAQAGARRGWFLHSSFYLLHSIAGAVAGNGLPKPYDMDTPN